MLLALYVGVTVVLGDEIGHVLDNIVALIKTDGPKVLLLGSLVALFAAGWYGTRKNWRSATEWGGGAVVGIILSTLIVSGALEGMITTLTK